MSAQIDLSTPADYRLRVVIFYRARASESLDRARQALETGQIAIGRFHLDEAQAWAQFASHWARKAFAEPSDTSTVGEIRHG
jgi:hypothetical protein